MNIIEFAEDYDKSVFYKYLGVFFGEREYRKLFPYLINDSETQWKVALRKDEVIGFISYKLKGASVNIGYCYGKSSAETSMLLKELPEGIKRIELEKHFDLEPFIENGFSVYKESKNYYYMECGS